MYLQRLILWIVISSLIGATERCHAQIDVQRCSYSTLSFPSVGYYFVSPLDAATVPLLDQGGYFAYKHGKTNSINVRASGEYITSIDDGANGLVIRDAKFTILDTYKLNGSYQIDLHECYRLANGNVVLLGTETRETDMSKYVSNGDTKAKLLGNVIQVQSPSHSVLFEWKSLDAIGVMECADTNDLDDHIVDYIHINSIEVDDDGHYIVSCRNLDQIIKLNKNTGAIMWRLGAQRAKKNDFTWKNDLYEDFTGFSHQHSVVRSANGTLLLFDNGNLKPRPFSRVVEYKVDETAKTVEAVWSYSYHTSAFVPLMGSVQELPNGNVLIGYGGTKFLPVANEVTRTGTIVMEMNSEVFDIQPYRVYQYAWGMAGQQRYMSSVGAYSFSSGDSSSYVTANVETIVGTVGLSVTRHYYAAKNPAFTSKPPCTILPVRWSIYMDKTTGIVGNLVFELAKLPNAVLPSKLTLYRRDGEGTGAFTEVKATFNAKANTLTSNIIQPGEYVVGYTTCLNPSPIAPDTGSTLVALPASFSWTEAIQTAGYAVEIYKGTTVTGSPVITIPSTLKTDTLIAGLLPLTTYTWRVRSNRIPAAPWSYTSTFTTSPKSPTPVKPVIAKDTAVVAVKPLFAWTLTDNKRWYRLQLFQQFDKSLVLDTLLADTVMLPKNALKSNTWYEWKVRVEDGQWLSAYSTTASFITKPSTPRPTGPLDGELLLQNSGVTARWDADETDRMFHVQVFKDSVQQPWYEDTVTGMSTVLPALSYSSTYSWNVRAITRYGASDWSASRLFRTRSAPALAIPVVVLPKQHEALEVTSVRVTWTSTKQASSYSLEVYANESLDNLAYQRNVSGDTSCIVDLTPGTTYYLRVKAYNATTTSEWSAVRIFSVASVEEPSVTLVYPTEVSSDVGTPCTFSYTSTGPITTYEVVVARDSACNDRIHVETTGALTRTYDLPAGSILYWKVKGISQTAQDVVSRTARFVTSGTSDVTEIQTDLSIRLSYKKLTIEVPTSAPFKVSLFTIQGLRIGCEEVQEGVHLTMDVSALPVGMYFVTVQSQMRQWAQSLWIGL